MRRIATLAIVLAICATLTACGSSATTLDPASKAARARALIVRTALAQKSVHWTQTEYGEGFYLDVSSDVNTDSGVERMAGTLLLSRFVLQIRFVDRALYAKGNAASLRAFLDLSRAQAKRFRWKWISIPKGYADPYRPGYDDLVEGRLTEGLTLPSIVRRVAPQGKLKLGTRTSHEGRRLVVLSNAGRVLRLQAAATGKPLPVAASGTTGWFAGWFAWHFSKWNEPVHVQAPASSTPIATVRGS